MITTTTSNFAGVLADGVIDPLLRDLHSKDIQKLFFDRNPVLKEIRSYEDLDWDVSSRRAVFTLEIARPGSFIGLNELEAPPKGSASEFVQGEIYARNLYSTFEITGQAYSKGTNGKAVANLVKHNMKRMMETVEANMERMVCGDATGVLCDVASYNSGTKTVTIDPSGANDIPNLYFLHQNSNVAWGSVSGTTFTKTGSGKVVAKPRRAPLTFVISVDGTSADPAAADVFVMGDSGTPGHGYRKEFYGLKNILKDQKFLGIDWDDVPEWEPQNVLNTDTTEEFTAEYLTELCDEYENVTDQMPTQIMAPPKLLRTYQGAMVQDVRYVPGGTMVGGAKGLQFVHSASGNSIPLVRVRSLMDTMAILWQPSKVGFAWQEKWGWRQWDGGKILRPNPSGLDAASAYYQAYGNLGCKNRKFVMGVQNLI